MVKDLKKHIFLTKQLFQLPGLSGILYFLELLMFSKILTLIACITINIWFKKFFKVKTD